MNRRGEGGQESPCVERDGQSSWWPVEKRTLLYSYWPCDLEETDCLPRVYSGTFFYGRCGKLKQDWWYCLYCTGELRETSSSLRCWTHTLVLLFWVLISFVMFSIYLDRINVKEYCIEMICTVLTLMNTHSHTLTHTLDVKSLSHLQSIYHNIHMWVEIGP